MAELSGRGQMLLTGAVALAILMVSLAFVLNGGVQTTADAGRASADVSASDTVLLQESIREDVGRLILASMSEGSDFDDRQDYVEDRTDELGPMYGEYYAQQDRIISVDLDGSDIEEGVRTKNSSGSFADSSTRTLSGSTRIRRFNLEVAGDGSVPLEIEFSDGSTTHRIRIDASERVYVDGEECPGSGPTDPRIEITNATVNGESCPDLAFFDDFGGTYSLEMENGDDWEGGYNIIASDESLTGSSEKRVVYGATVEYAERSPTVAYRTEIRIAPGEPR